VKSLKEVKVLSLEQATVVPYLTYRLAQDGMQVIRMEHPIYGDPNRLIGDRVIDEDRMNAYFLCINSGKKAITLNLAEKEGQQLLKSLITKLDIDIFVTNQLPKNYKKLGIDYDRLKSVKSDIIWMGITGFGPDSNEAAYDPILQSRSGLLELTGEPDAPPQTIGVPLPDMGTSEHGYGLLMKALLKREMEGTGSEINLSMFESSVSWLTVPIALSASFGKHITRKGNTHEFFCPVRVYETADGFIYLAVGNDKQWRAMVSQPAFLALDRPEYGTNNGRAKDAKNLHAAINAITGKLNSKDLIELFNSIQVPVSKINTIQEVLEEPIVKQKSLHSEDPVSKLALTLVPPPHETSFLKECGGHLSFPPRFGEHNKAIYCDVLGYTAQELATLREKGVI
jgi:crotonobetainyl-CoA:carnitine CoA-transferase CaiB-like acyl-CoA transferase